MSDIQIQPRPIEIARVFLVFTIATVIVLILAWLLTGGGGELFEPRSELNSLMPDASGLIVEAPVQLDGIQIGKIGKIELSGLHDAKKVVRVEMKVKTRYLPAIPVDSTISITADDLLGDKYLNISSGHSTQSVRPGGELRSYLPIGDQFNSADLVAAMKDMLDRVDASIEEIEDPRTPIGQFVQTDDMYKNILAEIVSIEKTVRKSVYPQSDFGKMLFTDELYQEIRAPIVSIDRQLASLQAGEGEAGHLLVSSEQYDTIRKQLAELRNALAEINAGHGAIGGLFQSDAAYRKMERLVKTMDGVADSISSGEGGLGVLLNDSQLYESLTGSTGEMQHLLHDFRTDPRKYLRLKIF